MKNDSSSIEINWSEKYKQLKDFQDRFGHCDVPFSYPENPSLGRWVRKQRVFKEQLPEQRIQRLNEIGFQWRLFELSWEKQYTALVAYKEKFGHCNVSKKQAQKEYRQLARWLNQQRKYIQEQNHRMSQYKLDKLNALGI